MEFNSNFDKPLSSDLSQKITKALSKRVSKALSLKISSPEAKKPSHHKNSPTKHIPNEPCQLDHSLVAEMAADDIKRPTPSLHEDNSRQRESKMITQPLDFPNVKVSNPHFGQIMYPTPSPYHDQRPLTMSPKSPTTSHPPLSPRFSTPNPISASASPTQSNDLAEHAVKPQRQQTRNSGAKPPLVHISDLEPEADVLNPTSLVQNTTTQPTRPLRIKSEAVQALGPVTHHHNAATPSASKPGAPSMSNSNPGSKRAASDIKESVHKKACIKPITQDTDCEIVHIVSCDTKEDKIVSSVLNPQASGRRDVSLLAPLHLMGMGSMADKVKMNISGIVYTGTTDGKRVYMLPFVQDQEANISVQERTNTIRREAPGCKLSG
jgi:hypothetical protein